MSKRKQSEKDSAKDALDVLSQSVFKRLMTALTEKSDLDNLPLEIIHAVHNLAVFKVLKTVNFPLELQDATGDEIREFDAFANETSHILIEYCEGLRTWRPASKN